MSNAVKKFGQHIRYYRREKNLSQEQLAELCGLHPTYIGQLERGEKNASIETVIQLCKGLDITPSVLFENITTATDDTPAKQAYELFLSSPSDKQELLLDILRKAIQLIN